jgi:hypothetical protein
MNTQTTTALRARGAADPGLLGVYLEDHLAGAAGGLALARRIARSRRGSPAEPVVDRLAVEIAEDRDALVAIAKSLGHRRRRSKVLAAWLGEKVGRLKLNGRLAGHSPLSEVVEYELLMLGVEGKAAGWRTLGTVALSDHRLDLDELDQLHHRARRQAYDLEDLRIQAVMATFSRH